MYRSSSCTRVSDEFFSNGSASLSSPNPKPITESDHLLPTLHPQSHVAKKEKYRLRSAENAVHLIPVLLVFCAVVLWFFSSPAKSGVDPAGCVDLVKHVSLGCPNLEFCGLMTIGMPDYTSTPENFKTLANCRSEVCKALGIAEDQCELSMGMSGDFELAILDIVVSLAKVADVDRNLGNEAAAVSGFQEAIKLLESLTINPKEIGLEQRQVHLRRKQRRRN